MAKDRESNFTDRSLISWRDRLGFMFTSKAFVSSTKSKSDQNNLSRQRSVNSRIGFSAVNGNTFSFVPESVLATPFSGATSTGFVQTDSLIPIDFENPVETVPCNHHVGDWLAGDFNSPRHAECNKACCKGDYFRSSMPGAQPIYFAYRYTGCHFTWYPREFSFGKDPYISQCNGFLTRRRKLDELGQEIPGSSILSQNSCSLWAYQRYLAGSNDPSNFVDNCMNNAIDIDFSLGIGGDARFPCACVPVPHIHGGINDSLYNRTNVTLTPYQMGYVSKMIPFSPPMEGLDEAGCCWCASTANPSGSWDNYSKQRKGCFRNTYPYFDGKGRVVSQINSCQPGLNCYHFPGEDPSGSLSIAGNPNYKRSCYQWGISPYLLRIARTQYRMAYEIWRHGKNADYLHDFGTLFQVNSIQKNDRNRDLTISFKRISGTKSKLRDQYIGFVQLEHHFECYAFRSDEGSLAIELKAVLNHCSLLIPPFERGYGGKYTPTEGGVYRYTPWGYDSVLYQTKRGVPRRVMYAGSGIPIFHFDLIRMERICQADSAVGQDSPVGEFIPEIFLSHYYRYFFSMIAWSSRNCSEPDGPEPVEWDYTHLIDSFDYVRYWLKQMVKTGVLRIKDHAIDIARETNTIIASGTYTTNAQGNQEILIPDAVSLECGGLSGYLDILNFFGVCAGQQNAITPKIVKEKLLNPQGINSPGYATGGAWGSSPSATPATMRAFLPRRARLPLSDTRSGITAWGCCGSIGPTFGQLGLTCPAYIRPNNPTESAIFVPPQLNATGANDVWSSLSHVALFSGLASTFVLDITGKLSVFGGVPTNGDQQCSQSANSFTMYPDAIACVPSYLSSASLFQCDPNISESCSLIAQDNIYIPDGTVIDLAASSPRFAVALCDFQRRGVGCFCAQTEEDPQCAINSSVEIGDTTTGTYLSYNCNGANVGWVNVGGGQLACLQNEPFWVLPGPLGTVIEGPRTSIGPRVQTYRLKSWGSWSRVLGTFSLAWEDANLYGMGLGSSRPSDPTRGYDPEINPNNLRYPGTNTWFIWQKVASGLYHCAAIDDFGGIFVTPQSINLSGQANKGKPLEYSSIRNRDHKGFESRFNYFNHVPRPGYVKEDEWNQLFYNAVTSVASTWRTRCECYEDVDSFCLKENTIPGGGFGNGVQDCYGIPITLPGEGGTCDPNGVGNCFPFPYLYDQTCFLMGSLVQGPGEAGQAAYRDSQPQYIDVAAGHYNTMLLTNENRIELYGTYYQIDEDGNILGPSFGNTLGFACFVPPEVQALQGNWNVTYGCPIYCKPFETTSNPVPDGVTISPIIGATYNEPTVGSNIKIIRSSADYSLCVTEQNDLYIWGDASMVPGKYDPNVYVPGQPASTLLKMAEGFNFTIEEVAVGVHAFYVYYKVRVPGTSFTTSKVYSYTRYGEENFNINAPNEIQNKTITDISAGNGFAVAIYATAVEPKVWDYQSFAPDHEKYQYKNFNSLPEYYKRDAFFHATPGNWDYSKWLWDSNCCAKNQNPQHPALQPDSCSILGWNIYNDTSFFGEGYTATSFTPLELTLGFKYANIGLALSNKQYSVGQSLLVSSANAPQLLYFEGTVDGITTGFGGTTLSLNVDVKFVSGSCSSSQWVIGLNYNKIVNPNLQYSGHPEHLWMRGDIRRLTVQSFEPFKNVQNPIDPTSLPCSGPGGSDLDPTLLQQIGQDYGSCLRDYGNVWAESRPAISIQRDEQKLPMERCAPINQECFPGGVPREVRGTIPDDVPSIAYGMAFSTPQAYRSTKDLFQLITVRYRSSRANNSICPRHDLHALAYFKYCQRNYYLGYDDVKDTWEIYDSPDILRTQGHNYIIGVTNDDGNWSWYGATFAYPGFTGNTSGGYFGIGNCGWTSLQNYPGVGPNYAREDYVLWPDYEVNDRNIGFVMGAHLCNVDDPTDCDSPCITGPRSGAFVLLKYAGPGGFMFRYPCNGASVIYGANAGIMWNRYIYYNIMHATQTPEQILFGVKTIIDPNILPSSDPNYQSIGFLDVLLDPTKTERFEPWKHDSSTKWKPLCWESRSYFPTLGITSGDVLCFAGTDSNSNVTGNNVEVQTESISGQTTVTSVFTVPVLCNIFSCCAE